MQNLLMITNFRATEPERAPFRRTVACLMHADRITCDIYYDGNFDSIILDSVNLFVRDSSRERTRVYFVNSN